MRRARKLKACIFLIAWATIFAHNVVPHSHEDENTACSGNLIHDHASRQSEGDLSSRLDKEHSDSKVCHLSNFLYHNLSPEAFPAYSFRDMNFDPESQGTKIYFGGDRHYISDPLKDTTCLRAPPPVS